MNLTLLFGSYREPSNGRRILPYLQQKAEAAGFTVTIADAKAIGLPMLEKMYKEYQGDAPPNMEQLAETVRSSDAFIVVAGEYNHSLQPGLANMMDHFLEEWNGRPIGIAGYSAGRFAGVRVADHLRIYCSELGLVSIPVSLGIGAIQNELDNAGKLVGDSAQAIEKATDRFLAELKWYAEALKAKRTA